MVDVDNLIEVRCLEVSSHCLKKHREKDVQCSCVDIIVELTRLQRKIHEGDLV